VLGKPVRSRSEMGNCKSRRSESQQLERCNSEDNNVNSDYYSVKTTPYTSNYKYDVIFKCAFIGPSKTGKSLLSSVIGHGDITITNHVFSSTIGVDFNSIIIKYMNRGIKLHCWDTAGDKRFATAVCSYLRNTQFVLLFCDLTNPHDTLAWLVNNKIPNNISYNTKIFLVCDSWLVPKDCDDGGNSIIKQLQADITGTHSSINIIDTLIFDFRKQQEFATNLNTVFGNLNKGDIFHNLLTNQVACKKPAIYIYDRQSTQNNNITSDGNQTTSYNYTTQVDIQLHGHMNVEIPIRDDDSRWQCQVMADGLLIQNKVYPYIYWEADWPRNTVQDVITGQQSQQQFVMSGIDYSKFSQLLSTVLSQRELADFDAYWQPLLRADKHYRVNVVKPQYFDTVFPLSITVSNNKSYQIMRLEFIFEELTISHNNTTVLPQQLNIVRPTVNYDTQVLIVEWGGSMI